MILGLEIAAGLVAILLLASLLRRSFVARELLLEPALLPSELDPLTKHWLERLATAGFREPRAWRPQLSGATHRFRALTLVLTSRDARTEAVLSLSVERHGQKIARTRRQLELVSQDASGGRCVTTFGHSESVLVHPRADVSTVPRSRDLERLVAGHAAHLTACGLEAIALDPVTYAERARRAHAEAVEHALERGLVRAEGLRLETTVGARGLRVRSVVTLGVENRPWLARAVVIALAALGLATVHPAHDALGSGSFDNAIEAIALATFMFASIALVTTAALSKTAFAWLYALAPAALALDAAGSTSFVPWLGALFGYGLAAIPRGLWDQVESRALAKTVEQDEPPPSWKPALAPVEYAIAVAVSIGAADLALRLVGLGLAPSPPPGSLTSYLVACLLACTRDGALTGAALGLLALRAERTGRLPGWLLVFLAALAVRVVQLLARAVPAPWESGRSADLTLVLTSLVGLPVPVVFQGVGLRLALAAQGRRSEGLRLGLPRTLAYPLPYLRTLTRGFAGSADWVISLVGSSFAAGVVTTLALPLFTHLVPRTFRALGIYTREERADEG